HQTVTLRASWTAMVPYTMPGSLRQGPMYSTRPEPRTYSYPAEAYRASFALSAQLTVDLVPGDPPLVVALGGIEVLDGYSHDTTFKPAHVAPTRPNFPSADQWLD